MITNMKTKKLFVAIAICLFSSTIFSQDSLNILKNSADKLLAAKSNLTIGGYAQIDYNQEFDNETRKNGNLDVHRMVMLLGYRFNDKTQFITELEFEHVKEIYVEQAFLQYKINPSINLKAGLMLIPMGLINEYHEPTAFNGVERPLVDSYISPTTWREIGAGFNGLVPTWGLKYQAYIVNGFSSYDGVGKISGEKGLRGGRQKGAESFISSPNISARLDLYSLKNLQLGASIYYGKTQSSLYDGIDKKDNLTKKMADSSVVRVGMIGIDVRYKIKKFLLKGQYYYTELSNTNEYNAFTGGNDLGSSMIGGYIEASFTVSLSKKTSQKLAPFVRYEYFNTHNTVEQSVVYNKSYANNIILGGLSWRLSDFAVIKADVQFMKPESENKYNTAFNAGVGVMF